MELICDLADLGEESESLKIEEIKLEKISEKSLIPESGLFLGLDISEVSSGVCLYENGEKLSANISLVTGDVPFQEVLLRRELKSYLTEVVEGKEFDLIIIEDAFQGMNPTVTRKLYAINTAIDELILDGVCKCKDFRRINNQLWKSWLYTIDTEGQFKGLSDKLRIQKCLELLDVYEDRSEGYQDRLDSCGMILGYMLCKDKADEYEERKKKKRVSIEDVNVAYNTEQEFCLEEAGYGYRDISKMFISDKTMSKDLVLNYLTDSPNMIFVTDKKVSLGLFGSAFNLPIIDGGGYLAFWVNEKRVNKYLNN